MRPSLSVSAIVIVLPFNPTTTSPGLTARPPGIFSQSGINAEEEKTKNTTLSYLESGFH